MPCQDAFLSMVTCRQVGGVDGLTCEVAETLNKVFADRLPLCSRNPLV